MRKSVWLTFMIILIVVACTLLMLKWRNILNLQESNKIHKVAYFSDINYQEFNNNGQIKNHYFATEATVYSDKTSQFVKPNFLIYTENRVPWKTTSDRGNSSDNNQTIHLIGNVKMHQLATPNNPETRIDTASLWIYPKKSLATTKRFVSVRRPDMHVSGIGMRADLKNNQFQFFADTRGQYTDQANNPPYQFKAGSLKYNGKIHQVHYRDNVQIQQSNTLLQGQDVVVDTDPKTNQVKTITALGKPAHYKKLPAPNQDWLNASADKIVIDKQKNIAMLTGHAEVEQAKDLIKSDFIWYDISHGVLHTKPTAKQDKTVIVIQPDISK